MQIQVSREACCAQDDQLGPLEATYCVSSDTTLRELVATIVASGFLQYSSSHVALQGEARGVPVVRVFAPHASGDEPARFMTDPDRRVERIAGRDALRFRFVANDGIA